MALLKELSETDCKKTTAAEQRTLGVTAYHIADGYELIAHIITTVAAGQTMPHFTTEMLDEMNAKLAQEHAGCTRPEMVALYTKVAAAVAVVVHQLSDEQLAPSGIVFPGDAERGCGGEDFLPEPSISSCPFDYVVRNKRRPCHTGEPVRPAYIASVEQRRARSPGRSKR